MDKPYYAVLPKEARLQLLIEADYPTILELCQDPLFKDICDGDLLWREKLKREFGLDIIKDAKWEYLKNYRVKLDRLIKVKEYEMEKIDDNIETELEPLNIKMEEEIKKIRQKYNSEKANLKMDLEEKYGLNKLGYEVDKLKEILSNLGPAEKFRESRDLLVNTGVPGRANVDAILNDFSKYGKVKVGAIARTGRAIVRFDDPRNAQDAREGLKDKYTFL